MTEFVTLMPSDEMIEFRMRVERAILQSLSIPRGLIGACHGHAHVKGLHPSLWPNFYCSSDDVVLVDGFKREHVIRGRTGANGYAIQAEYHKGRPVLDKRGNLKTRVLLGVVVFIPKGL